MAEVQLRSLRVSASLDSADYVAGMQRKIEADRAGTESANAVGAAVTQTDQKLSQSGNVVDRLSRQYVDGYANAQKFQTAMNALTSGVERGRIEMTQAAVIYDGMQRKYGLMADASALAARGQLELSRAVEVANAKLAQQQAIGIPLSDYSNVRALQVGSNFTADLNSRLGVDGFGSSARTSAAAFEEAAREAEHYARAAGELRARLDPVGASQARLNAEMMEYAVLLDRAEISTVEFAQAQAMAQARHDQFVASLNRMPANDNMSSSRDDGFRRQNLGYQLFDIGQSASLGMPLAMIAAQQGPQIAQLYATQGGLNAAMKDFGVILGGLARVAGPFIAIGAGLYGVYQLLASYTVEATLAIDDNTRALAAQAAPITSLQGSVKELSDIQKAYNDAVSTAAIVSDAATASIVANSQREFEAKKALLELELKRQEASIALQQSELAIAAVQMKRDIGSQIAVDPGLVRNGFSDPAINGGIPFVQVPDQFSGMEKLLTTIESSPAADKIKEIDAHATLTQIAVEKLREGLKLVFSAGGGDPVPNFPNGVPIPSARPIDGGDESAAEKRLSLLRQEAGARADIVSKIEAQQRLLQSQNDDLAHLRLEASLIGASAEARARATAALEAEQKLRADGIALLSREGQTYVQNAQAMASARVAIEQQAAAYSSLQTAGSSAIDALVQGTSSMEDIANTLISSLKTLAISNPISNATLGTNLPSIWSLFSGAPTIPGATTTGMMTVNAATVMINGAMPGIPGLSTGGGLGGLLGVPANQNTLPSTDMLAYAASIRKIESGSFAGNYSAVGPTTESGDRAYGAYQVMGANVGPWTKEVLGQPMTTEQFLANKAAQDAVFQAKFGQSVSQYGNPQDAASVWFSGRPMTQAANSADITGTTTPAYIDQFNSNLSQLSTTTAATSSNLGTLGQTSTQLGSAFGNLLTGTGGAFPPAPASGGFLSSLFGGGVSPFSPTYFPPAPTGYADGTDFAPGGVADVGERGKERVYLPRGSQVIPNHKLNEDRAERSSSNLSVHIHNNVGAKVKTQETQDSQGNRRIEVMLDEQVAGSLARSGSATRSTMEEQYNVAPRIKQR